MSGGMSMGMGTMSGGMGPMGSMGMGNMNYPGFMGGGGDMNPMFRRGFSNDMSGYDGSPMQQGMGGPGARGYPSPQGMQMFQYEMMNRG